MRRKYRTVTSILSVYNIDAGCTCPILVKLDDDRRAVFKYPRNPQGMMVLLNEYVTSHLAQSIHLTCPNFGVAVLSDNVTLGKKVPTDTDYSNYAGIGFYSEFIPQTFPVSYRTLRHAVNLDEASRIILLDQIVKNSDRHEGNLILTTNSTPMLYAIDHSHAFGDPDWDIARLSLRDIESPYIWQENLPVYNMLIGAGADVSPRKLESECQLIQKQITDDALTQIFATIPLEWVDVIGSENISHLRQYILNRVQNLETICNMIIEERGV